MLIKITTKLLIITILTLYTPLVFAGTINITAQNGTTTITSAADESWQASSTVDQAYNKMSMDYNRGRISANSESKIDSGILVIEKDGEKIEVPFEYKYFKFLR